MACCVCCCETKQNGTCCGTGGSAVCCPEGEYCCDGVCDPNPCNSCCFVDLNGTHPFSFGSYSGTVAYGIWFGSGSEYLTFACTGTISVCGVSQNAGLFIEFYDGADSWQGSVDGNWDTHSCSSQQSLVGTYTLTNCTTSATQSLTVT